MCSGLAASPKTQTKSWSPFEDVPRKLGQPAKQSQHAADKILSSLFLKKNSLPFPVMSSHVLASR
jgi:hypothetical protein